MLSNLHTHTSFSDGVNTAEEVVLYAIKNGFSSLGISDHGYTTFDNCITALKEKYKNKIDLYLGIEEDAFAPVNRNKFDYIIGSCHYVFKDGVYYPVDSSVESLKSTLLVFDNNPTAFADSYYKWFVDYITTRKPDIIGHFDLLTKYDETLPLFLDNKEYKNLAEKYLLEAIKSNCIFEVNTGAISRGYRKNPYPSEELLHILKKEDAKIILSSDSHNQETLDYAFCETSEMLKDIGFKHRYVSSNSEFKKVEL